MAHLPYNSPEFLHWHVFPVRMNKTSLDHTIPEPGSKLISEYLSKFKWAQEQVLLNVNRIS